MKVFVDWVLAQRARLVIVAVVAAPLLPVVSGALIALQTVRRGTTSGSLSAAGVVAGLMLLAALSRTDVPLFGAVGAICAASGVAIGSLLRRYGSLVLGFQAAVLMCWTVALLIGILGIDARPFFAPAIDELAALLPSETSPEDVIAVQQRSAAMLLSMAVFALVTGELLLGYWWSLLAAGQRRFGHDFRQLKLGRMLGAIGTAVPLIGLVFDAPVVQNLTPLAVLAFGLQGVAVLHAWAHAKRWNPALIAPIYVCLLLPGLNLLLVLSVGMLGLVDQWFDLRASLRRGHDESKSDGSDSARKG